MSQNAASLQYGRAQPAASMRLMALSIVLWAVGVVTMRLGAPIGLFSPGFSVVLMLATVPLAWATVNLAVRVAGPQTPLLSVGMLASMPALLLDGAAFTWAPGLYGPAAPFRPEGAWLLWFVGVSLAIALLLQVRQTASH